MLLANELYMKNTANLDNVVEILLWMSSKKDMKNVLLDLLSQNEILEVSRRLQAWKMLMDWINYNDIAKVTWMSSTTIARISKTIKSWSGGYAKAYELLNS